MGFFGGGGGGSGTVESVSVVTANGLSGTVADATTTPAITLNVSGLDATKIADGTVTSSEFQFINTLTSNAQTQLDAKATANATTTIVPYLSGAGVFSDSPLVRLDANTIDQRNSTNPQAFSVYDSFTDASNYSRLRLTSNVGGYKEIIDQIAGTGGTNGILVTTPGLMALKAATIYFQDAGGTTRWRIENSGHLITGAGSTYNIATAAAPVLTVYTNTVGLIPVAFAALPASPAEGMIAAVTDSNTATWGATIAGGGANNVLAFYNGSNWTVFGA